MTDTTDTTVKVFFGDNEHSFCLTPELIPELERQCEIGVGGLCRRLFAGNFRHEDILATIRLSLIGGGLAPKTAADLIAAYGANRPLAETYPIAVSILEALWFGNKEAAQ